MRLSTCLLAWALLACPPALAQRLYQWKDAQGVNHYSDVPPSGSRLQGRRIDAADALARGAMAGSAQAAPAENAACSSARLNQKILSDPAPVRQMDADGKPGAMLSDSQRSSQRELADAAVGAYCTQSGAAPPG